MVGGLFLERLHTGATHPDPDLCHGRPEQAVQLAVWCIPERCGAGGQFCEPVRARRCGGYRCPGRPEHRNGCQPHHAGHLPDRHVGGCAGILCKHQQGCRLRLPARLARRGGCHLGRLRRDAPVHRPQCAGLCECRQWHHRHLQQGGKGPEAQHHQPGLEPAVGPGRQDRRQAQGEPGKAQSLFGGQGRAGGSGYPVRPGFRRSGKEAAGGPVRQEGRRAGQSQAVQRQSRNAGRRKERRGRRLHQVAR